MARAHIVICETIRLHHCLAFVYQGLARVVEPYCHGIRLCAGKPEKARFRGGHSPGSLVIAPDVKELVVISPLSDWTCREMPGERGPARDGGARTALCLACAETSWIARSCQRVSSSPRRKVRSAGLVRLDDRRSSRTVQTFRGGSCRAVGWAGVRSEASSSSGMPERTSTVTPTPISSMPATETSRRRSVCSKRSSWSLRLRRGLLIGTKRAREGAGERRPFFFASRHDSP